MLRACNPADLVGLLFLQARAEPNSAYGKDAFASGEPIFPSLSGFVGEWIPSKREHRTWVLSQNGWPVGVVSVHRRRGNRSWEVDCLQVARGKGVATVEMLDQLTILLGRLAADRLFLRMAEKSAVEEVARQSGFIPLVRETLYVRPQGRLASKNGSVIAPLRIASPVDAFDLLRLYTMAVPARVRQAEGVGLKDWQECLTGKDGLPREEAWVIQQEGEFLGAALISKNGGKRRFVDLLARPMDPDSGGALVRAVISKAGGITELACLLPEYQNELRGPLEENGFKGLGTFHLYYKPIMARVKRTGLLPVGI